MTSNKVCKICLVSSDLPARHKSVCKKCLYQRNRVWSQKINSETGLNNRQTSDLKAREQNRDRSQRYHARLRYDVLGHYSNFTFRCECCNESTEKFLTIDHVVPYAELKTGDRAGFKLYRWLITNNFPEGFRVLCYNCNCGRARNNGVCPHKEQQNVCAA